MENALAAIERAAYQNGVNDVLHALAKQEFSQRLGNAKVPQESSQRKGMMGSILESWFGGTAQGQTEEAKKHNLPPPKDAPDGSSPGGAY
mmetsp:Transcript_16125/g.22517  ORF Transcript_16125/g.22517 Transcript_16125/m.22517 type:complete len:90 (+) Transcript_16125:152-421(+)